MHTFSHIPTHSHTFFSTFISHTFFFHICCTHNFPTAIVGGQHRWGGLGRVPIFVWIATNQSWTIDPRRVLRVEGSHANTPFTGSKFVETGQHRHDPTLEQSQTMNSEITYSHNILNCILHFTVVSFCGVWRHSFFSGWSNISTLCTVQLLF